MLKKLPLLIVLTVFIASCSHIPLSTMLSMSSFNEEDFLQIKPENIRTKITTNTSAKFIEKETYLTFKLINPQYKIDELLPLKIITENISNEESWLGEKTLKHVTTLKLTAEGVQNFKDIQQLVLQNMMADENRRIISFKWELDSKTAEEITLTVDLLFDTQDGYFTLIEDFEMVNTPDSAE